MILPYIIIIMFALLDCLNVLCLFINIFNLCRHNEINKSLRKLDIASICINVLAIIAISIAIGIRIAK